MTPGNSEDMTACFGAWNAKTTPERAFSSCPNRPHHVASVYCQRRAERVGGGTVEPLGKRSINGFYQEGKNIKLWWRE